MIICLGTTPAVQRSMSFDRVAIDSVNRTADVVQYASGKSINAARVLHTLSKQISCTGFIGQDCGQFLINDLDAAEIPHRFVRVEPPTRVCVTLIDRSNHTATELIEESHKVPASNYEQLLSTLEQLLLRGATALLLSGSLPPGAPVDFYARCVSACVGSKIPVIIDATGEPLRPALPLHPMVIKPNRQELAQTVNLPVETDDQLKTAIRQLLAMGPQWAVITDGSRPSVVSDGKTFWKVSTPKVAVVSPIGSGDAFAAGLTAGIVDGLPVPQACQLAAACGAANAMTDRAGHVLKTNVERLSADVEIAAF